MPWFSAQNSLVTFLWYSEFIFGHPYFLSSQPHFQGPLKRTPWNLRLGPECVFCLRCHNFFLIVRRPFAPLSGIHFYAKKKKKKKKKKDNIYSISYS